MVATIELHNDRGVVTGELSFKTVLKLRKQGETLLTHNASLLIDLQEATVADNSALSLLTAWVRFANKLHKKISFTNLPPKLHAMLTLSGLVELLPIK